MPTVTQQPRAANPATKRIMLAFAVIVVLVVAFLVFKPIIAPGTPHGGDPSNNIPALKAVKTFDYVGAQHTTDPVTYTETPPAGGPHDPVWQDCGVYTQPLRNENAVHSLEHGTVWVTYRPGTSAADVQSLQTALGSVKDKKTILSPYPGLPAPVVVTVWNAQLDLKSASDPRLAAFLTFYGDGHTAPEAAMASCAGGKVFYASPSNP
ncbi:MAG: DUF3105 domain-containing protein [Nocardioides sp.]